MGTKTAMAVHSTLAAGQVAAGVALAQAADPWWAQIAVQAAGLGLQSLFAWLNSITDQKGRQLPPATP